jgi:AGZA family xanthine/uracil permease-like MFS transporter
MFLIALFFSPLVQVISGGYPIHDVISVEGQRVARTFTLYPVTSPALIVVGSLMMKSVRDIEWDDFTEAFPAFLMIIVTPLTFSITDGIAFGFISYALLKLVTGRAKEAHWLIYFFAVLFIIRYALPVLH